MSDVSTRSDERSGRPGLNRVLVEAGVLLLVGGVLALSANQLSPRGLKLARDYFPKTAMPVAALAVKTVTRNNAERRHGDSVDGVTTAIIERLRQKGLQALGHARVVQLYHDPQYAHAVIFVDARDDAHYQAGHIPGAYQFDSY